MPRRFVLCRNGSSRSNDPATTFVPSLTRSDSTTPHLGRRFRTSTVTNSPRTEDNAASSRSVSNRTKTESERIGVEDKTTPGARTRFVLREHRVNGSRKFFLTFSSRNHRASLPTTMFEDALAKRPRFSLRRPRWRQISALIVWMPFQTLSW